MKIRFMARRSNGMTMDRHEVARFLGLLRGVYAVVPVKGCLHVWVDTDVDLDSLDTFMETASMTQDLELKRIVLDDDAATDDCGGLAESISLHSYTGHAVGNEDIDLVRVAIAEDPMLLVALLDLINAV